MAHAKPFFETVVRPYRSLNAFGFRLIMAVLIAANVAFAMLMISLGAWPVTGFLGLDMLGVYLAFRWSFRQTAAYERITIADNALIVAQVDMRGRWREWRCPSYWASVALDEDADDRGVLTVGSHGTRIQIGHFLHPDERTALARELRQALLRARDFSAAS